MVRSGSLRTPSMKLPQPVRFTFLSFFTFLGSIQAADPFLFLQIHDRSGAGSGAPVSSLIGTTIPLKTPLILGPLSRAEFGSSHFLVRVGAGSEVEMLSDFSICLTRGSMLIQPKNRKVCIDIKTKKSAFTMSGSGCFVVEATSNGGCKVLSLESTFDVSKQNNVETKISAGNLLFVVPDETGFGPRLDVDLNVFRMTSGLINGFEKPLERFSAIKTAAFKQTFRIRGRTNALIGDAKSSKNYDILFLK